MSIDFHPDYPYLLAAGFSDGTVSVYNLRRRFKRDDGFVLRPLNATDKHFDPVWQVI